MELMLRAILLTEWLIIVLMFGIAYKIKNLDENLYETFKNNWFLEYKKKNVQ